MKLPCPACKKNIAASATKCPYCQHVLTEDEQKGRTTTQRTGYIGCGVLLVIAFLGLTFCSSDEEDGVEPIAADESEISYRTAAQGSGTDENGAQSDPTAGLSAPQRNARRSAESYLSMSGFSRLGLIDQLSSEYGDGYERADAEAAVDSLDVDWNRQAVRSAEGYLEMSGFSCAGLIDQLSSSSGDEFTESQARYGAEQAGAC